MASAYSCAVRSPGIPVSGWIETRLPGTYRRGRSRRRGFQSPAGLKRRYKLRGGMGRPGRRGFQSPAGLKLVGGPFDHASLRCRRGFQSPAGLKRICRGHAGLRGSGRRGFQSPAGLKLVSPGEWSIMIKCRRGFQSPAGLKPDSRRSRAPGRRSSPGIPVSGWIETTSGRTDRWADMPSPGIPVSGWIETRPAPRPPAPPCLSPGIPVSGWIETFDWRLHCGVTSYFVGDPGPRPDRRSPLLEQSSELHALVPGRARVLHVHQVVLERPRDPDAILLSDRE